MPTQLDQLPGGITGLARKVAALERQLKELRAAKRLGRTAFSAGALQVVDGNGDTVAEIVTNLHGRSGVVTYDTRLGQEYYAALTAGDVRFGITGETDIPGEGRVIFSDLGSGIYELLLRSGSVGGSASAEINLYSESTDIADDTQVVLNANLTRVTGALRVDGLQSVSDAQSGTYNVTSTTYTTAVSSGTYVDCAVVFTAPPSGRVTITTGARMINGTAGSGTLLTPETRTGGVIGGGTVFEAVGDGLGISYYGDSFARMSATHHLTGLTAGAVYNTRILHRTTANTSAIALRELIVEPAA